MLPNRVPLEDSSWGLIELIETGGVQERRLPDAGVRVTAQVWPDKVQHALVLPIKGSGQGRLAGFLIVGVSPRRPLRAIIGRVDCRMVVDRRRVPIVPSGSVTPPRRIDCSLDRHRWNCSSATNAC